MSYIIIWNLGSRDHFIHQDTYYHIEQFDDYEEAVTEAKQCVDGDQYRKFTIFEEDYRKIK